ncbi:hypothetical protein [Microbacterium trichothecenolyticum]|uniref:Uncharacterized protein n=1 Tax=Microbacterium trichothecenolyticum TaxID=69370 RepID=A0A0M2HMB0_MICTR|nr:hypothetical protein [Microbacterium trichothecenolyticum]KJL45564.1 hypothetical protein RS82_00116 [Microbacterium trichothecenolyticum]
MYYTFTRVDKRAFVKAFEAGQRVRMGRDTSEDTVIDSGFTKDSVADPFADTGRGGVLRYWVAVAGSETPVGRVDFNSHVSEAQPWGFYCLACERRITSVDSLIAAEMREAHVAGHAHVADDEPVDEPGFALDADGESDVTRGVQYLISAKTHVEEAFEARLGVNYRHEHLSYWVSVEDIEGNVNGLWVETGEFLSMCERILGGSGNGSIAKNWASIAQRAEIRDYAWHRDGEPCIQAMSSGGCGHNHRYGRTFADAH